MLNTSFQSIKKWTFKDHATIDINGNFMTDNSEALIKAAVSGIGLILAVPAILKPELTSKALVPVLPELRSRDITVYAYYHKRDYMPLKIKHFLEYIETKLADAFIYNEFNFGD